MSNAQLIVEQLIVQNFHRFFLTVGSGRPWENDTDSLRDRETTSNRSKGQHLDQSSAHPQRSTSMRFLFTAAVRPMPDADTFPSSDCNFGTDTASEVAVASGGKVLSAAAASGGMWPLTWGFCSLNGRLRVPTSARLYKSSEAVAAFRDPGITPALRPHRETPEGE